MDIHTTLMSVAGVLGNRILKRDQTLSTELPHIVDQLIAERTRHLSQHPL